jgi:signal transduction histidine kinase/CheY-like chemotaxis protein
MVALMDLNMADKASKELAFDLRIAIKQVYFSCITGTCGIVFIIAVLLVYAARSDSTFYRGIVLWGLFGLFNILWRVYFYITGIKRTPAELEFSNMNGRRWQGALLAGVLWGSAAFFFLGQLNFSGQLLLLFALVTLNFTGIPTLYASEQAFFLLWAATWMPLLFVDHDLIPFPVLFVLSGTVLFSGLFISYALRKGIKDLFFMNEASSEKIVSLDKDNEQLKMFFLAANHDLSQPIAAIQHAIYAMEKQAKDSEFIVRSLEIIRTSAASLSHLIEDIIHFERITSGISKADMTAVDLDEVFKRVITRCEHLSKAKGVGLWSRTTGRWAVTDAYILERILVNLVENALRYTTSGSVILAARPRGDQVSIEVWDSGLGMAKEDLIHIFEVFYRLDATKDMYKGYGLGLSIVKRLAESIGGAISVRSVLGKGSVFKLLLPTCEKKISIETLESVPLLNLNENTINGMKIALLDDDKILLSSLIQVLQSELAVVTSATTLQELASLIAAAPSGYDVIVTDWNLRISTGEQALTELKNIPGFNPAWIVMSGDISADKEAELKAHGVNVIRKPFSPDNLIKHLSKIYVETSSHTKCVNDVTF